MKKTDKKIAWLLTTMGYGEQLLYWEPILSKFTEKAPNTLVFLTPGKVISKESYLNISEAVKIFRITLRAKGDNSYGKVISIISPMILKRIWTNDPDLIVLSEFGLLTLYGLFYKILRPRCKVILLVESNPGDMPKYRTLLRRLMCKKVDAIMTNNTPGKDYLQNTLKIHPNDIILKPYLVSNLAKNNSTESNLSDEATHYIQSEKIRLLCVGRLAKPKGIDLLFEAIANLDSNVQEKIQLAIVGSGSDADTKRLITLSEKLQIEGSVNFIGRVPYNDLKAIYSNSDIFVLPTLNDYRALVGFEAISCGLPVLLSIFDGSSSEIVDEGRNGYTIDPTNIEDFSSKLEALIKDKDIRRDYSKHSLFVASKFTSENAANNLIEAVTYCLGDH